jgi:hypothetical protein
MKRKLQNIANASSMIEGSSYDRSQFEASSTCTRSLLSGAVSTGLVGLAVYCGYQMMDSSFAVILGEQAMTFKIAASAAMTSMLGYALRDLFTSVTSDVETKMRVARANSWLSKGTAFSHDMADQVAMQQTRLCMVRFVEGIDCIKVYAIAQNERFASPILIETTLDDHEYQAQSAFYTHLADIRSRLHNACAEWAPDIAPLLGIEFDTHPVPTQALKAPQPVANDRPASIVDRLDDDLDLPDDFFAEVPGVSGRAGVVAAAKSNQPLQFRPKAEILRQAALVPAGTVIQ